MKKMVTGLLVLAFLAGAANAAAPKPSKRRKPDVLTPVEVRTVVLREQVDTYIFNRDFTKILSLKEPGNARSEDKFVSTFVPLQAGADLANVRLARQPQPVRMALIAASFPCWQQVEEFQEKLGLSSAQAVLEEIAAENEREQPAFRFLGVNVQRRTLDEHGEPLTNYRTLDLSAAYKPWLMLRGRSFEAEDPRLAKVIFPGLVMPRLRLFRAGRDKSGYPPLEKQLETLQETIQRLAEKPTALPDYCLLRVIDVTLEPNTIYQYRLQVRMANPNFGRKDAANPELAKDRMLVSAWYQVPRKVVVPPDLIPYVVDQKDFKEKDGERYKGMNWNAGLDRRNQVAFQLHRWVDVTPLHRNEEPVPVGEWAIADRVIVARGEYVGRTVKVDLPVWRYTQDAFILPAEDQRMRGKIRTGINVNFGHQRVDDHQETILVDFEGGRTLHEHGRESGLVKDTSSIEVLLLSPEDRLLARNSASDAKAIERQARRGSWRARVEALKAR